MKCYVEPRISQISRIISQGDENKKNQILNTNNERRFLTTGAVLSQSKEGTEHTDAVPFGKLRAGSE